MVGKGHPFWQWSTMVNHGPDNDFIIVFDGLPLKNMVDHQKASKTVVTMVDHVHHFAWNNCNDRFDDW